MWMITISLLVILLTVSGAMRGSTSNLRGEHASLGQLGGTGPIIPLMNTNSDYSIYNDNYAQNLSMVNYTSGWWYVNDIPGLNCSSVSMDKITTRVEGYALNVCFEKNGSFIKYQCDGVQVTSEQYEESNCTNLLSNFSMEAIVGCNGTKIYNCSSDALTIPVPTNRDYVVQLFYSNDSQCTGQAQHYIGEPDEYCFHSDQFNANNYTATNAHWNSSGSYYTAYPYIEVYPSNNSCMGNYTLVAETTTCTLFNNEVSAADNFSFSYVNTTLIREVKYSKDDDDNTHKQSDDDALDNTGTLVGVIIGAIVGAVLVISLCLCGMCYMWRWAHQDVEIPAHRPSSSRW